MKEVLDLLIAHHIPWIALAFLAIWLWPRIHRWWAERQRGQPETAAELRVQLQEVERQQAALNEQMQAEGQNGTKLSTTAAKD